MGICGSKPDGASHQASASTASAPAAAPSVPTVACVHSDIINDAVVGGGPTEIVTSSEDGTCVLYDWKQAKAVRFAFISVSLAGAGTAAAERAIAAARRCSAGRAATSAASMARPTAPPPAPASRPVGTW